MTENTDDDHGRNVCKVVKRLQDARLRLKLAKCEFLKDYVEYFGRIITAAGLHPSPRDVETSLSATIRKNFETFHWFGQLLLKLVPSLVRGTQFIEWSIGTRYTIDQGTTSTGDIVRK